MKKNQIILLYSLLFKSSNFMLRISIGILPFIIAISFASIFFINNLSGSYKHYLLEGYIGTQGILTVKSKNKEYLSELKKEFISQNVISSLKKIIRKDIVIKTSKFTLENKIKLIILEKKYLSNKLNNSNQNIVINKILLNTLGENNTFSIKNSKSNNFINIDNIKFIDTGFLTSEPLIFMSKSFFDKLGYKEISFDSLELSIGLDKIIDSKKTAEELSSKYKADIIFEDILSKHTESQKLFDNIAYIEYIVLAITSLLAFIILTGALNIISKIKEKAISLLRIYGLSTGLISLSLTMMSLILLSLSLLIAYFIFTIFKIYFVYCIGLENTFFIPLDLSIIQIVLMIFMIFLILTYVWGHNTFKGKITI